MVSSGGMAGPDVLQLRIILNNMPRFLYQLGEVSSFRGVWGNNWDNCFGTCCLREPVKQCVTGLEEGFGDVASDDF